MKQIKNILLRCRAYIRMVLDGIRRKFSVRKEEKADKGDDGVIKQSVAYQILIPDNIPIGATYAGQPEYRKIKVKNKTEALILLTRVTKGRGMRVTNKGGNLYYTTTDKVHKLIFELQYKKRKAPRRTIATLTITNLGRAQFPIRKIYFCLKGP